MVTMKIKCENIIFVDFETDGLDGPLKEICSVQLDSGKNGIKLMSQTLDGLCNLLDENKDMVVIFWHHWMIEYVNRHPLFELSERTQGKCACLVDAYAIVNGNKRKRYSIDRITQKLLGRKHEGNAVQDAIDLAECYEVIQKRLHKHVKFV